jgi:hypothetical protein
MSIYLAAGPLSADMTTPRRRLSTPSTERAGLFVVGLHAIFLAAVHWMLFNQFADRAMPDLHGALSTAFAAYSADSFSIELLSLLAAVLAVAGVRLAIGGVGRRATIAGAGLLAYVPIACYSLGVALALAFGWEPDIFIMAAADATNPQVADTIQEALPIVLQPLAIWRQLATVVAALVFAVLQRRLCGIGTGLAIATAGAAGLAALAVQFTML